MTFTPAFEIGVWNAWIFIVPYILAVFGLPPLLKRESLIKRKSTFWESPSYTRLERMYSQLSYVIMVVLSVYSVFLPLAVGTVWLYAGLAVYIMGFAFAVLAVLAFIATPVDKPNTTGVYRISRHPGYLGMFSIYIGIGVASASWVYLLLALILLAPLRSFMISEERWCCERFGDAYREYLNRTPRWIGISKSGSNRQP